MIADAEGIIVAYASLSMTGVDRSAAPDALGKGEPDPVPALLIGRLAVGRSYAGLGVGTALVGHALATAAELNASAACRAVVVTSPNARPRSWWERFDFRLLDVGDPEGLDLFLLTSGIEATLRRLR